MLIELLSKKCYCIVSYSFTWKIIWNFSFLLKCHFLLCVGSAEYTPNYATTSWKRQAPRTGKEMQQKPTKGERAASFFQFPAAITPRVAAVRCPSCTPFSTRPTPRRLRLLFRFSLVAVVVFALASRLICHTVPTGK